jgi:Na+/proline symporter
MENAAGVILGVIIGLILGIVVLIILGLILNWLWNTTIPEISDLREITTAQAIKLLFITSILFGGHRVITVPAESAVTDPPAEVTQQQ